MLQPAIPIPVEYLYQHNAGFASSCWAVGLRPDQRSEYDSRPLHVLLHDSAPRGGDAEEFGGDEQCVALHQSSTAVTLSLGNTRVETSLHCHIVEPHPQRPKAGFFSIDVDQLNHERSGAVAGSRGGAAGGAGHHVFPESLARLQQYLMNLFRGGVVDTVEGLCVIPGRHVWSYSVQCCVMQDDGNVGDAVAMSVLAVLLAHRRPEVQVVGDHELRWYGEWERDPVPLTLLHSPVSVTFAIATPPTSSSPLQQTGAAASPTDPAALNCTSPFTLLADPTMEEMFAAASSVTVAVNPEGQVVGLQKGGGATITATQLRLCMEVAQLISRQRMTVLEAAITAYHKEKKEARTKAFHWAKTRQGVAAAAAAAAPASP